MATADTLELDETLEYDPAVLYHKATLHIHVPKTPPPDDLPRSTCPSGDSSTSAQETLSDQVKDAIEDVHAGVNDDGDYNSRVDAWVSLIASSPERDQAFYGESHAPFRHGYENVPFYAVVTLPSSPELNRTQAISFLVPTLTESPHLSLTADVAYINGSDLLEREKSRRSSSLPTGLGLSNSINSSGHKTMLNGDIQHRSSSSKSTATLSGMVAPANGKLGMMAARDSPLASDTSVVPLWSTTFKPTLALDPSHNSTSVDQTTERVWIGRDSRRGCWVGVWEFAGPIPFVPSNLASPRLCLTITITFRDDPRIADLLERTSTSATAGSAKKTSFQDILQEEDEYIVESLDDVNLLAGLSKSFQAPPLHLPASRLPAPLAPSATSGRRLSRFSLALPGVASADAPIHPIMRRSLRRLMDIKSVITVRMRTVPCPVDGLERRDNVAVEASLGAEARNETNGLIMCVEVEGAGEAGDMREQFQIDDIQIKVSPGAAGLGDVEVRRVADFHCTDDDDRFPLFVSHNEQHNFLYAVTFTSEAAQQSFTRFAQTTETVSAVPIEVASSPSQRFTARFDDSGPNWEAEEQAVNANAGSHNVWIRNVSIVIKGRPRYLESSNGGYHVADTEASSSGPWFPTRSFASTWNSKLDISPFAVRAPPKHARFTQPDQPPPIQTALSAGQRASHAHQSTSIKRAIVSPAAIDSERIAGSKRHTVASLASLARTAPAVLRPRPQAELVTESNGIGSILRAPVVASSSAASAAARFFSLPSSESQDKDGRASMEWNTRSNTPIASMQRGTTPGATVQTVSTAIQPTSDVRSSVLSELKRDSWRQTGAAGAIEAQPATNLPAPTVDHSKNGQKLEKAASDEEIIMTVSLLPLRSVKSSKTRHAQLKVAEPVSPQHPIGRRSNTTFELPSPSEDAPDAALDDDVDVAATADQGSVDVKDVHGWRAPRIGLLDVFLIEVFVLNRSTQVKRFTVGMPVGCAGSSVVALGGNAASTSPVKRDDDSMASLVALENDVRIGPLLPNSCASVRLRFLAIRPGSHALEQLRVVDVATGLETRLRQPLWVTVQG
ncbi:hypothetical protein OIO90_005623 [Microbotryomycetes sp. JL221]|nr:hypothetical protein OIO90_005623 [Microbotryomycetes sp. JL221]